MGIGIFSYYRYYIVANLFLNLYLRLVCFEALQLFTLVAANKWFRFRRHGVDVFLLQLELIKVSKRNVFFQYNILLLFVISSSVPIF